MDIDSIAFPIYWWHWVVLGLVLIVLEITAAGGFYIIFFGIAAVIVGLLASVNLIGPLWVQLLLFPALSVGLLAAFRGSLLKTMQRDPQRPKVDPVVGEIGTASEDLAPGNIGRVELRGTAWSARNEGDATLVRGTRVRVVRVEGLTLHVVPEGVR